MSEQHTVGEHVVRIDEDLITVRWHGKTTIAELQQVMGFADRIYADRHYVLLCFDVSAAHPGNADTRRWVVDWHRGKSNLCLAAFGASLVVRTLLVLINSAARLFNRETTPMQFFASEGDASAWLAGQRTELKRMVGRT